MLYIFGGLPGTGKSTLASALARRSGAVYIRIDTIEQAMRNSGATVEGHGYLVGYGVAIDNLRLERNVVADSVNPLHVTRKAWIDVALDANASFVEIETICSDPIEHRRRIESRKSDIIGLELPDWQGVVDRHYEKWGSEHVVIDTAGRNPETSITSLFATLRL